MRIVVDASPLILLAKIDQLDLLPSLASRVDVPQAVLRELAAGGPSDQAATSVAQAAWVRTVDPSPIPDNVSSWDLGVGETAVLSWAIMKKATAVVDDRAARKCAEAVSLPFLGTLGVVLAAKDAGMIPAARPLLERLTQAGYYLSDRILTIALKKVGE